MKTALLAVALLSGCATVKLTEEGKQVRVINSGVAATMKCQHLGMVQGWSPALEGGMPTAQIKVRNQVGKAGGNALVITSQSLTGPGHGEILGDAYRCVF